MENVQVWTHYFRRENRVNGCIHMVVQWKHVPSCTAWRWLQIQINKVPHKPVVTHTSSNLISKRFKISSFSYCALDCVIAWCNIPFKLCLKIWAAGCKRSLLYKEWVKRSDIIFKIILPNEIHQVLCKITLAQ